jgi:hypothetical protein
VVTAVALSLIEQGTGGGASRAGGAGGKLVKFAPGGLAIAGALTGSTTALAPPSMLDWTSSGVHRIESRGAWMPGEMVTIAERPALTTATQNLLQSMKQHSGLTWGLIADAIGVEVRAVHLWRNGGGISAAHEARLHDLGFLVDSVRLREPGDVRGELVRARSGQSLLDAFRSGVAARDLALAAPWRIGAREGLDRSVAARLSGDAVDEDFAFLLYDDDAAVAAFASHASALLEDPATSRRDWESVLDGRFREVEQPPVVDVASPTDAEGDAEILEPFGVAPLFDLEDLGVTLGVGAIASRPAVDEEV